MRSIFLVVAALALVGLAACGSDNSPGTTSALDLTSSTWELKPTVLGLPGADRIRPTLRFAEGAASGFAGCNQYHGPYTLSRSALSFGPIATTQMACGAQETAVETAYLDRLGRVASYKVSSAGLDLADSKGAIVLSYDAADPSLKGNWTVTGYLTSSGTAFTSVVIGSELTISFADGGLLSGSTGCNRFTGTWAQGPSDAVSIKLGAQTAAACASADLDAQEASITKAWSSSVRADVAGSEATFFNAGGQRTVTATR